MNRIADRCCKAAVAAVLAVGVLGSPVSSAIGLVSCTVYATGTPSISTVGTATPVTGSATLPINQTSSNVCNSSVSGSATQNGGTTQNGVSSTTGSAEVDANAMLTAAGPPPTATPITLLLTQTGSTTTTLNGTYNVNAATGDSTSATGLGVTDTAQVFSLLPGESASYTLTVQYNGINGGQSQYLVYLPAFVGQLVDNGAPNSTPTTVLDYSQTAANLPRGIPGTPFNYTQTYTGTLSNTSSVTHTYTVGTQVSDNQMGEFWLSGPARQTGIPFTAYAQFNVRLQLQDLTYPPPPVQPTITSWSPTSGPVGTVITVNGTGLAGLTSAWVGAGHDATIQNDTATSVQIVVPKDASTAQLALGNGSKWVFTGGAFTVTGTAPPPAPLSISSWGPTSGPVGTVITINGTGLAGVKYAWVGAGHDAVIQNATANSVQIVVPKDASSGQLALGNGSTWVFTSGSFTIH